MTNREKLEALLQENRALKQKVAAMNKGSRSTHKINMRESEKELPLNGKFRTPYYELGDAINGFLSVAKSEGDHGLLKLIIDVEKKYDLIIKYLNKHYLWD